MKFRIGDTVKLKSDLDSRPSTFKVRALAGERVSCRLIRRSGKRGGLYLFRRADIELL